MTLETTSKHKFLEDSAMTFQEVFMFAFNHFVPELHRLAQELGEAQVLEALKKIGLETALKDAQAGARQIPCNDFATFKTWATDPNYFWKHVLTFEIVENTALTFEIKVTECLWAKTFRELGAANVGYPLICHPDYASCQGFNPLITMSRSKTLMQGDDCCNPRWVWGG